MHASSGAGFPAQARLSCCRLDCRMCCSAPGITVNQPDVTPTSATAKVTPPATGGPYDNYKLTVCPKFGPASDCKQFDCAPADIAACPLTGLTPNTE